MVLTPYIATGIFNFDFNIAAADAYMFFCKNPHILPFVLKGDFDKRSNMVNIHGCLRCVVNINARCCMVAAFNYFDSRINDAAFELKYGKQDDIYTCKLNDITDLMQHLKIKMDFVVHDFSSNNTVNALDENVENCDGETAPVFFASYFNGKERHFAPCACRCNKNYDMYKDDLKHLALILAAQGFDAHQKELIMKIPKRKILDIEHGSPLLYAMKKDLIPDCVYDSPTIAMPKSDDIKVSEKIMPIIDTLRKEHEYVYDYCVAPGELYNKLKTYFKYVRGANYVGEGSFKCYITDKLHEYKDMKTLPQITKAKSAVFIDTFYDHIPDGVVNDLLIKDCSIVVKYGLWNNKHIKNFDCNYYFLFTPKTHSSEVYCVLTHRDFNIPFCDRNYFNDASVNFLMRNNYCYSTTPQINQKTDSSFIFSSNFDKLEAYAEDLLKSKLTVCHKLAHSIKDASKFGIFKHKQMKISYLCGVGGAGKSRKINKYATVDDETVIITSTNDNLKDFLKNGAVRKHNVFTPHTGLLAVMGRKDVQLIIDEFQEIPSIYLSILTMYCKEIFLIGDPNQIGYCDFNKMLGDDGLKFDYKYDLVESKRCPPDVAMICRGKGIPMVSTSVHRNRSIWKCSKNFFENCLTFKIAPTQETRDKYKCDRTIHEVKGQTRANVGLVIESADDINTCKGSWEYVAITRHTNGLFIYEPADGNKYFETLQAGITDILSETPVTSVYKQKIPMIHEIEIGQNLAIDKVSVEHFEEVLSTIIPAGDEHYTMIGVTDLPPVAEGTISKPSKLMVNVGMLTNFGTNKIGKRCTRNTYSKIYNISNQFLTTYTAAKRYLKATKGVSDVFTATQHMWEGLYKFVDKKKCPTLEIFYDSFASSQEEVTLATNEYLEALQKKLEGFGRNRDNFTEGESYRKERTLYNEKEFSDIINNITKSDINNTIDFFMKAQSKYQAKTAWQEQMKAGQGVSAVSKVINIMFAAVSRLALRKLKEVLKENVIITSGEDIRSYKIKTTKILRKAGKHKVWDNDFEEWDSSNNEINIYFDATMFGAVLGAKYVFESDFILYGLPNFVFEMCNYYVTMRTKWRQSVVNKHGAMTIQGHLKQFSGQQHTLGGNTINNMALCGFIYDILELILAMFQGDDSQMRGNLTPIEANFKQLRAWGFGCKLLSSDDVGEYVGYVIHKDGWMPDLVRRSVQTASKLYASKDDFQESAIGLQDTMSVVADQYEKIKGLHAYCYYVNKHTDLNVNYAQSTVLFDFLKAYKSTNYDLFNNGINRDGFFELPQDTLV